MASSSSTSVWEYDVFLSFRGKDTRKNFVSHLYKELDRMCVRTFKDDKELERGKTISPEVLQAIQDSRFAVVVISENYASSGCCLEELATIMECHENESLTAIPIFYEVNPFDVRRQTGKFAEHFKQHEERHKQNPEKVQRWKGALAKVADISGEASGNWEDDSKLIEKIAGDISNRLVSATPSDFSDLIGMNAHMEVLYGLLDLESSYDVRMIGIWGMGGVGKTTIARYVYDEISKHFQTHCFLENAISIYQDHGPSGLQEEFLSKKLGGGTLKIRGSNMGSNVIKARFGHQKVLLVVDDIDKIDQLQVLVRDPSWFGLGSRIIITTRDKHLLIAHGVKHIYKVECLGFDSALQLFSMFAFKQQCPLVGFEKLSVHAAKLAEGLPLALRVFGSFLCGRDKEDWESELHRLEASLDRSIKEIFKVSYNGLDEQTKYIFLHIACLFNGEHVDHVKSLLDGCELNNKFRMKVLAEKSLITISRGGMITVHGFLQQVAREIVTYDSIYGHGKCKLLLDPKQIHEALTEYKGIETIEGISLDMSKTNNLSVKDGAFERMRSLKFLKFYNHNRETAMNLPTQIDLLGCKLKYLRWDGYPAKTIRFRAECLVELNMTRSNLQKLWEGSLGLWNLKKIDLGLSENLKEIPDLSGAPNLEALEANYCRSLVEIPSSIGSLKKLTRLNLWGCSRLERLPSNIDMKSLQILSLTRCTSLEIFPQVSRNIRSLSITLTNSEPPEWIGDLSCLFCLRMCLCENLKSLPGTIGDLTALEFLYISECQMLRNFPKTLRKLNSLTSLWVLDGRNINEFPLLPQNIREVRFNGTAIEEVPSWIGDLCWLQILDLSENTRLKNLPKSISRLKNLQKLNLRGCVSLENFPAEICETAGPLEHLDLLGTEIARLPGKLGDLKSLRSLKVGKFAGDATHLTGLRDLPIAQDCYCPPLSKLAFLSQLFLRNMNISEIPDDIGQLNNLLWLDLSGNNFEAIPGSTNQLTRLQRLCVNNCQNLRSIPELHTEILHLHAHGCIALGTTSQVFKHYSLCDLVLSNCFRLDQDIRQISKHMASKLGKHKMVCLPGSKVPGCFNHRSKGSNLAISYPREWFLYELGGFAACVVVGVKGHYRLDDLRMRWKCCLGGDFGEKYFSGFVQYILGEHESRDIEIQSDHSFLFNWHRSCNHDDEAPFSHAIFEFSLEKENQDCLSNLKLKECGVRLDWNDGAEEECDSSMTELYSSCSSADEEPEQTWKEEWVLNNPEDSNYATPGCAFFLDVVVEYIHRSLRRLLRRQSIERTLHVANFLPSFCILFPMALILCFTGFLIVAHAET